MSMYLIHEVLSGDSHEALHWQKIIPCELVTPSGHMCKNRSGKKVI